jgi:hypothetical protein
MADKTRGLPSSYDIDIPETVVQQPVQLGDYLEEDDATPVSQASLRSPATVQQAPTAPSIPRPEQPSRPRQPIPVPKPSRLATSVPRKQVNMTPETIRMVDELLDYIRTYSVQKDIKASELFHGLVLALYEARDHLDLSSVQPRGRWGTPTAAALPIALKNTFRAAIAGWNNFG